MQKQVCQKSNNQKVQYINKTMNQLSHGQKINFPASFVRSVSFQKIRQGSLSSRTNKPQPQPHQQPKHQKPNPNQQPSGVCQRLLTKKLLGQKPEVKQRRPMQPKLMMNTIQKSAIIRKQMQEKEMKQCTFKPKINKSVYPHRTLEEFVDQQMAYEKFKSDKVNEMRELIRAKMDKENTFQPNSVEIARNQNSKRNNAGQVHDRLYDQWSKKRATNQNLIPESVEKRPSSKTSTIKQKLTTYSRKNSQKSIMDSKKHLLTNNDLSQFNSSLPYGSKQHTLDNQNEGSLTNRQESQDRTRQNSKSQRGLRITKHMDVQQVCDKKIGHRVKQGEERQQKKSNMSLKNKELYIKKILREIGSILSELSINEPNLNYLQMSLILQKMNFLDQQTNLNDRKYSYEIWQMLQGDVYESCPLANLVRIVFCLLGCHDFGLIQDCLQVVMPDNFSARKLVLTQKQSKNIKINFQQLFLNRLRKGQHLTNQPKCQQYSFKPFISKNSKQMAQKYRQRIIQQSQELLNKNLIQYQLAENGEVDHVDLLLLDDKRKELKIKIMRQEADRERKRLEDQAMQADRRRKRDVKGNEEVAESRYQFLYELGKNNIRTKKQKLPTEQIPKECTFQPNLSTSKQHSRVVAPKQLSAQHTHSLEGSKNYPTDQVKQIKDFDKSIFRMYEGRRIREQSHNHTSKSNSVTERSLISDHHRSKEQEVPELYLNVCMEGTQDIKVPVFATDNMKTITHKVKVLMGLENAEDSKLEEILKLQILPTLQEIGMNIDLQ